MKDIELAAEICRELNELAYSAGIGTGVSFSGTDSVLNLEIAGDVLYDDQGDSHSEECPNELSVESCRKRIVMYAESLLAAYGQPAGVGGVS